MSEKTLAANIIPPPTIIIENDGQRIGIKPLSAVEKMRVYKILPPEAEQKLLYLSMVFTACSVRMIDDTPMPWPSNPDGFELVIGKIGDSGVEAVQRALLPPPTEDEKPGMTMETAAGKLQGGTSSSAALS